MYNTVSWAEVLRRDKFAYDRFEAMVKQWINIREIRLCFRAALPAGVALIPANVMDLFVVRAKHNFKWMSATCKPELMTMLIASGVNFSKPLYDGSIRSEVKHFRYLWIQNRSYWEGSTGNNE